MGPTSCGVAPRQASKLPRTLEAIDPAKPSNPALFFPMEVPFGAATGYLGIAIPFILRDKGVSLLEIGAISAIGFQPHALKFLWTPLLDLGSHRKLWFLGSTVVTAICLAATALIPSPAEHKVLLTVMITATQAAAATSSAALNALVAITCRQSDKARAGGYYMAGNVGGYALLGALGLWLASNTSPVVASLILATLVLAGGAFALPIVEPKVVAEAVAKAKTIGQTLLAQVKLLVTDIWDMVRGRQGLTGMVICLAPIGCGGLSNLFTGLAKDFGASEQTVTLVSGPISGVVAIVGSLLGGFLAERMNRRIAYGLAGSVMGLSALAMAAAPMTQATYIWGSLAYQFALAIAYATWAGMVLEMVGHTAGVASKYAIFTALANQATGYMTFVDGWAGERFGTARASLVADGLASVVGLAILLSMVAVARGGRAGVGTAPAR